MALSISHWLPDTSQKVLDITVGDLLREAARDAPSVIGLVSGLPDDQLRRWTYAQLLEGSERVARALLTHFEPGARIAVWAPNIAEWVFLELGAALAGMVLVTVNPAYRQAELEHVLKQSRAAGIFLVREFRGNPMLETLLGVTPRLKTLRKRFVFESEWDAFLAGGRAGQALPTVQPGDAAQIQYTS